MYGVIHWFEFIQWITLSNLHTTGARSVNVGGGKGVIKANWRWEACESCTGG